MHNAHSDVYWKTSGSLWQCYRNEPVLGNNNNIIDFLANNNNSISFKFKQQITGQTGNDGTKNVEIIVPLIYLKKFWRTLEILLINYEINLHLKWSQKFFLVAGTTANQVPKFKINDTRLYISVVTLSTEDNRKLLKQLESGFKKF